MTDAISDNLNPFSGSSSSSGGRPGEGPVRAPRLTKPPRGSGRKRHRDAAGAGRAASRHDKRQVLQRSLPSGRAALGAFFVTAAALGAFLVASQAGRTQQISYLVAKRDLEAGTTLGDGDVKTMRGDVPPDLISTLIVDPKRLANATLRGRVLQGELFQPGNLVAANPGLKRARLVPVTVDAAAAAGGMLAEMHTADVYATTGSNDKSTTELVATKLLVVRIGQPGEKLGTSTGKVTVVFSIEDPALALRLISATATAQVKLVDSTGAVDSPPELVGRPMSGGSHAG